MDENDAYRWLLCRHALNLPDSRLRALMRADPDQRAALLKPEQRRIFTRIWQDAAAQASLQASLARSGIVLQMLEEADFPALLGEISDPPPFLYCRGATTLLTKPAVAVVGSRRPSRAGERDAEAFGLSLAEAGFTVVSGLALGVDAAAHRGALRAGGNTIAVLGCGVDVIYPRRNGPLYQEIVEKGLVISEFDPGAAPLRHQFPRRNRIISGLCLGVLVVEAAERSGSLITARMAAEQNREVFALPGSIHNPASRGCNALIRSGAKLVETIADIVEEFGGWMPPLSQASAGADADSPASDLYRLLGYEPLALDVLASRSAKPLPSLLAELAELELDGWVEQRAGAWLRSR